MLHQMTADVVSDQCVRHAVLGKLPASKARALVAYERRRERETESESERKSARAHALVTYEGVCVSVCLYLCVYVCVCMCVCIFYSVCAWLRGRVSSTNT